jgi:hypothetical protein
MELTDIKKEHFANENFDVKNFLNSYLKTNMETETDIFHFKLKIIQREFSNEIEMNTNNLLKFSKILENDIQQTNTAGKNFLHTMNEIGKNKIDSKQLEEVEKAYSIRDKNKNLQKALTYLENK